MSSVDLPGDFDEAGDECRLAITSQRSREARCPVLCSAAKIASDQIITREIDGWQTFKLELTAAVPVDLAARPEQP